MKTLMAIWNVIADVNNGKENVLPVLYDFPEDRNVIPLLMGENNLLLVLNTTCFFMDCSYVMLT